MATSEVTLDSLANEGRALLRDTQHVCDDHRDFGYWTDRVAGWLAKNFENSGITAEWSSLPVSRLVVNNSYYSSPEARAQFNNVVSHRLKWLASVGREMSERAKATPDTRESDAVFTAILELLATSALPQQFKKAVAADISEARRSYRASAFKACVVMLGAALEGIMLGTLQRSDVITHLATASNVPGPIKKLGSKHPALSDRIGDELAFQDYKVCIHELVPGSDDLGVDNIQDFRNAIHPWKSIQEPLKYGSFDSSRALHYLASLHKIVQALREWKPT
jgi:hypothetical protein